MDDDDDFDDFGGFEAAEPVSLSPTVSQPGGGQEASPSPWAFFTTGFSTVGAKPDLLCQEDKFPEVLDPKVSRVPGIDSNQNGLLTQQGANGVTVPFEVNFPTEPSASLDVNIDDVTLANNILDGQFLTSPSVSSSGLSCALQSGQPTLSSTTAGRQRSTDVQPGSGPNSVVTARNGNNSTKGQKKSDLQTCQGQSRPDLSKGRGHIHNSSEDTVQTKAQSNSGSHGSTGHRTDHRSSAGVESDVVVSRGRASVSRVNSTPSGWESDVFNSVRSDTSADRVSTNSKESQPSINIPSASSLSPSTQGETRVESLQNSNTDTVSNTAVVQEVQQIRSESQAAVRSVVQEYKALMLATVQSERDAMEGHVRVSVQEQEDRFRSMLSDQEKVFEQKLDEERTKMAELKMAALKEKSNALQKEFEDFLTMEREKSRIDIQIALEEERQESRKKLLETVEEEREKNRKQLADQKDLFRKELKEEQKKHQETIQKLLEEQRDKFQEMLKEGLDEERTRGDDLLQKKLAQMEARKMLDNKVHIRHMASLDVFLEGARQQLTLLMNKSEERETSTNSGSDTTDTNS